MDYTSFVFLLGGHDLEMITIKQLLIDNAFSEEKNIADLDLEWGAKLSDYQKLLNDEQTFVGIELSQDITPPSHYINIDHHNENNNKSSSLEQVAELLKIELTRRQQLIAANDKGYIPAMKALGATPEEITEIRRLDRVAQGVTDEDERLAEKSIIENLTTDRGVTVIKSRTSKFSTITDRLYPCDQLLVYTDNELTIYGVDISILINRFAELSTNWTTYSGGGMQGYWGISKGKITKGLIKKIIKTVNLNKDPYSSHIFLFPFKFKVEAEKNQKKEKQNEIFIGYIKEKWKIGIAETETKEEKELRIRTEKVTLYNEKKYFHDFVHPAIFASLEYNDNRQINSISKKVDLIYRITIKKRKYDPAQSTSDDDQKNSTYENYAIDLNLKKITLDIYNEGIGIFSFHLDFFPEPVLDENNKLSNVLLINQYGRRLYPPFLDLRYGDFNIDEVNSELEGTKRRELPESISIFDRNEMVCVENWDYFQIPMNEFNVLNASTYIPKHILYFLGLKELKNKYWFEYSEKEKDIKKAELNLKLVLDDRMFVMSWLGAKQLTEEFQKQKIKLNEEKEQFGYVLSDLCKRQIGNNEAGGFYRNVSEPVSFIPRYSNKYRYLNNDFWYQYVFIDGSTKTCQNEIMQEQLLSKHTYDRWVGYNTLYGITRYSFVILSMPFKELKTPEVNAAFIPGHLQTIYFRMVSLVLLQRAMVLDFSKRINDIDISIENEDKKIQKEALLLYKTYRDFINKTFHREVTAQEQGIELYDMLQEHLRVEKQAKELEKEFDEMNRFISLVGENQSKARMKIFTILTGVFLIPTFILNLLKNKKIDTLGDIKILDWRIENISWESAYLVIFLSGFAFFFTKALLSWTDKENIKLYPKSLNNFFISYWLFRWSIKRWMIFLTIASILLLFYLITFQLMVSYLWTCIFTSILIGLIILTFITSKTNK